jgi:hypothetical protein
VNEPTGLDLTTFLDRRHKGVLEKCPNRLRLPDKHPERAA